MALITFQFDLRLDDDQLDKILSALTGGPQSLASTIALAISRLQLPFPFRPHGYASVHTDSGSITKGEIFMSRITTSGWAEFKFQPVDKKGNPTESYQKGSAKHMIVNDDGSLATIAPSVLEPDNELAFRANAVGIPGAVQLLSSVDGDPNADVERLIEASGALEIVPGDAVRGDLVEGATGEQEEAPPV